MPLSDVHTHVFSVEESHVTYAISSERDIPTDAKLRIADAVTAMNDRVVTLLQGASKKSLELFNADRVLISCLAQIHDEFRRLSAWSGVDLILPGNTDFHAQERLELAVKIPKPQPNPVFTSGFVSISDPLKEALKT